MFVEYSKRGCQFECRLRDAAAYANCIPWDYPVPVGLEGHEICLAATLMNNSNALKIFQARMDDPASLDICDCLPDCEETIYKTQESIQAQNLISPGINMIMWMLFLTLG